MANMTEEIQKINFEDNAFKSIRLNVVFLGVALLLALLQTQGITSEVVGLGIILFDGIALIPLVYLGWNRQLRNRYTLWIVPLITLWIADVFIYNNALTQYYLPTIILVMIGIVYLTSMHKVDHLYQTMIPRLLIALGSYHCLKCSVTQHDDTTIVDCFIACTLSQSFFCSPFYPKS